MIYHYPGEDDQPTYDLENAIADPKQHVERFMEGVAPLAGATVADIGAGGGYHACRFAERAAQVFAVEPAPKMLRQLYRRLAGGTAMNVSVLVAGAEDVPLRDGCMDVIHSRFAYFFGPARGAVRSCEPGVEEGLRLLRPGGHFFIVDNALTSGQFAGFLSRFAYSRGKAAQMQQENDAFFSGLGFGCATVESTWTAPSRAALRRVLLMEFPAETVDTLMSEVEAAELSYHYCVYHRQK
jgi:SAM-dependent methyltransferase